MFWVRNPKLWASVRRNPCSVKRPNHAVSQVNDSEELPASAEHPSRASESLEKDTARSPAGDLYQFSLQTLLYAEDLMSGPGGAFLGVGLRLLDPPTFSCQLSRDLQIKRECSASVAL